MDRPTTGTADGRLCRCWVFSGLGGDHRLYQDIDWQPLQARGWLIRPVDWRELGAERSMSGFVDRALELGIRDGDLLIGSSFGGMLAASLRERLPASTALLVGSACGPGEINAIRGLVLPLFDADTLHLLQALLRPLGLFPLPLHIALRMFCDSDPRIMAGMFRALRCWSGVARSLRIRRLHGRYDPILPWRPGLDYDLVLPATHLVQLERPAAVGQWLAAVAPAPPG